MLPKISLDLKSDISEPNPIFTIKSNDWTILFTYNGKLFIQNLTTNMMINASHSQGIKLENKESSEENFFYTFYILLKI